MTLAPQVGGPHRATSAGTCENVVGGAPRPARGSGAVRRDLLCGAVALAILILSAIYQADLLGSRPGADDATGPALDSRRAAEAVSQASELTAVLDVLFK